MAASALRDTVTQQLEKDQKKGAKEGDGGNIEPKEFFWDQFLKYISSGILFLTIINVSVEFLQGGGIICFTPSEQEVGIQPNVSVQDFNRDQARYVNSYCARSVPSTEYFPMYILIHGLLLIAPHYIWSALFHGDFDSFFDIARSLDRLRDYKTGEYDAKNLDRVKKLKIEYGGKNRDIFRSYILKLFIQLGVCIGSIVFSAGFFIDYSFSFQCPENFSPDSIPENWPLQTTVACVYTSLRLLSLVRFADYILLLLALGLVLFGLAWCYMRHKVQLGYKQIAKFSFQSCLTSDSFVFPPAVEISFRKLRRVFQNMCVLWCCCSLPCSCEKAIKLHLSNLFNPRIRNDLDFLLMRLFRADSSHGRVFKDIQVTEELKSLTGRDHQLLHLYLNVQQDIRSPAYRRTQVKKEALPELLNILSPVIGSWELFVGQLGVSSTKIGIIKAANVHIGHDWIVTCFRHAMELWVANHSCPTYEAIIAVLTTHVDLACKVQELARKQGAQVKEEALPELLNLLSPLAGSWELFMQQIGVSTTKVDEIKAANVRTQSSRKWVFTCFKHAMEWWVANRSCPKYEDIIAVLNPKPAADQTTTTVDLSCQVQDMARKQGPIKDLTDFFVESGFTAGQEEKAYDYFSTYLGNTEWQPVSGIRDRLYGFVKFAPIDKKGNLKNGLAIDISFGSIGYSLALARPFKQVVSVNFHPFYRDEKESGSTKKYYTNYITVTFPEDIFTWSNECINKAGKKVFDHIQKMERTVDFIVVGPLNEEAKKSTVNLLIELLFTAKVITEEALLLAIRPLKVAHKKLIGRKAFCRYKPPKNYFDHTYHEREVEVKLRDGIRGFSYVDEETEGVAVDCDDVHCIFEFMTYQFTGKYDPEAAVASTEKPPDEDDATSLSSGSTEPKQQVSEGSKAADIVLEALESVVTTLQETCSRQRKSLPPVSSTEASLNHSKQQKAIASQPAASGANEVDLSAEEKARLLAKIKSYPTREHYESSTSSEPATASTYVSESENAQFVFSPTSRQSAAASTTEVILPDNEARTLEPFEEHVSATAITLESIPRHGRNVPSSAQQQSGRKSSSANVFPQTDSPAFSPASSQMNLSVDFLTPLSGNALAHTNRSNTEQPRGFAKNGTNGNHHFSGNGFFPPDQNQDTVSPSSTAV